MGPDIFFDNNTVDVSSIDLFNAGLEHHQPYDACRHPVSNFGCL
jgi:hypothetical protein